MKSEVAYILGIKNKISLKKDGQVIISEEDKNWLLRVKNKIEQLGYPTRLTKQGKYRITIHSRELYNQILKYQKTNVINWTSENKKEYIKALASTNARMDGQTLIIPTENNIMSNQVRYLLSELGITATPTQTQVSLKGTDIKKLYEQVGIDNSKILKAMIIAM